MSSIDARTADALRATFKGPVLAPEDGAYEAARALWNGDIRTKPGLIARCTGVADVMAAVRFARENGIDVSVRAGGHSVAGHALVEDGLTIDISGMTGVRVDPMRRIARAQGGALLGALDRETQAFGLAVPSGIVTHTGIGGLTLGGGIGHLIRAFGLTIDSLTSADVVTADGEFVVASERENADLFWGLRGGGGNFGIVTEFEYRLHTLTPTMLAGMVVWPMDDAPAVLAFLRDFLAEAPEAVGIMGNLRLAPALPIIPEELHGKPIVAIVVCYAGPIEEAEAALAPVRAFGTPVLDTVAPKLYTAHQAMFDPAVPHGNHYYWKSHALPTLTDTVIDIIAEHSSRTTSPLTTVPLFCLGGAVARVGEDDTAYSGRSFAHDINIAASWLPTDPEPDRHREWVRDYWRALEPHRAGLYVNFVSDESDAKATLDAYGADKYRKLVDLKNKYDATNFFARNANIAPASDGLATKDRGN